MLAVHSLLIIRCGIHSSGVAVLCQGLPTHLCHLDLSRNYIEQEGMTSALLAAAHRSVSQGVQN